MFRRRKDSLFSRVPAAGTRPVLLFVCAWTAVLLSCQEAGAAAMEDKGVDFAAWREAVEAGNDAQALSIGDETMARLAEKHRAEPGFTSYTSKLKAAEFLARQMQQQLRRATNRRLLAVGTEVFEGAAANRPAVALSVPPAKRFYETSVGLFAKPVSIGQLEHDEKSFLAQYYDLKLRMLISDIAKAGQALAVAEPAFTGTYDYVMVLPLVHASKARSVNIEVLPEWMRKPPQLDVFSDSCLLHFGFPFHSMMVAKKAAEARGAGFSEVEFYRAAARKCGTSRSHTAADCLEKATALIPQQDADAQIPVRFELVQLWLDSGDYALAAAEARNISTVYPDHAESGRALWLCYYALSRNNSTDEILNDIDKAVADKRCAAYRPKLLYIKWWALRRKRDRAASVAALEYKLLKDYGKDPVVAPVLLSHATDLLAGQDYTGAYSSLTQLVEKFPSTRAAAQARKMLQKLKTFESFQ